MSYNIQNITLIILILILIIVIIYYLRNSSTKHNELIEKYTTPTDIKSDESYNTHNAIANSQRNSEFPTSGTEITLRDCQVQFNDKFDGYPNDTVRYVYEDGWQEIATLKEPGVNSTFKDVPIKIISRSNETNQDAITNYSERSKCFRKMSDTDNKYRYQGNDLIQYRTGNNLTNGTHSQLNADGALENYMEMKFNLDPLKTSDYYNNLKTSICSLKYSNTLGGTSLGDKVLYRLTLNARYQITAINQITINSTNNHIFTVNLTTDLAALLTSSDRTISYVYNDTNFVYKDKLNNTGTQINGKNNIDVEIYTFNRELLCNRENGENVKYQTIKSYKIIDNNKIDVNTILKATSGDVEEIIENTNFPGTATDKSYSSKDSLLTAIDERIKSEKDTANASVNTNIEDYKKAITTKEGERKVFLDSINTKATFFDKIFDADTVEIRKTFLVSESGLISGLELNKLGYMTKDATENEILITATQEPSFSILNSSGTYGNVYETKVYKYNGSGDFTQYDESFPGSTLCDILIVGGGGAGSSGHGGGGGAGQLVFIHQAILNGTYTIKVGRGGVGGITAEKTGTTRASTKGFASSFGTVIAEAGGTNTSTATDKNGGSGAGGDAYTPDSGTTGIGNKNTTVDAFPGATVYSRGNNGGDNLGLPGTGGGGGGAGQEGATGAKTTPFGKGGDGLSGISEINYDFKTNFGANVGKTETDGLVWFAAGGGGGGWWGAGNGGKGGGGNGKTNSYQDGDSGMNNTGSGGGGGAGGGGGGGNGGSGIVIIKYRKVPQQDGNEKKITLKYENNYNSITYDFTPYNTLDTWKKYANDIGARFNFTHGFFGGYDGVFVATSDIGYFELTLPSTYNTITVTFTNGYTDANDKNNLVNLKINGIIKDTATSSQTKTYTQLYNRGDILRIEEIHSYIRRDLKITLTYVPPYRVNLTKKTNVKINNQPYREFNIGNYNILMNGSSSTITDSGNNIIGTYNNMGVENNELIFTYKISKTLNEINNENTNFNTPIIFSSKNDENYYSLGNKSINTISRYKLYICKKISTNHDISLYVKEKGTTNIKQIPAQNYQNTSLESTETANGSIILFNYYISIDKSIAGEIYVSSSESIFYMDETSRTTFNNTTDAQFLTNVNKLTASGTTTLARLNDMFGVTQATGAKTTEEGKLITYNITRPSGSHAQITIDFKSNPVSKTSLNNLATAYNNISGYSPKTSGGITPKLNANFGDILNSAPTDIDEYISYEFPSPPTDTQITPSNRANRFNIKSQATKYVYFKKKGGGQTQTSSVQTPNDTPSQNANSQSTGGNQASGLGDIKVFKANDTVTIPPGGWNCDILMIGGGGGANRGGGGAGACIVAIGQKLPAGTYIVTVGNGGGEYTSGGDSSISVGGNTIYLAKGGGSSGAVNDNGKDGGCGGGAGVLNGSTTNYDGGIAVATNIVNGIPSGPAATPTYAVFGNRGGHQRSTTGKSPSGYYAYPGGGGGIGSPGQDNIDSNPDAGNGGKGLNAATINGITYNFKQHFGVDGFNGNGYIGGGGGGDNGTAKNTGANGLTGSNKYSISYKSSHTDNLPDNTGSGGNGAFGAGSSGIVIIRVRT